MSKAGGTPAAETAARLRAEIEQHKKSVAPAFG